MKRVVFINCAILAGLVIFQSAVVCAASFDSSSGIVPFVSCHDARLQARHLIAADQKELKDYYRLKELKPGIYPANEIQRARFEALSLIRQYRDNARRQESVVLNHCSVSETESTLHRLEQAFDRLNIELAVARFHHKDSPVN